ncbi:RNA polymerase factor sigma-54 [Pseudoxanthomonas japonensis]|uniref:RNA polymerase sigma-54 factor n=1 Tax=Pseudoxanthomonas japonensis TaxID=69284 RepID=A0ABQ6ZF29_9GAMM|nr:RNA polymerase factor sigma-54 [Pseudoxanthomonas japonensis]KAF1724057.1 RNA polymerase sigma-54 factor [Pseudoxanthomonas japonensis]MCR6627942.1 RNA polymerase factor sigma-54 [Pseudoxanthomonas sp.]PZQ29073.1 MAG: RNA polymerase sigma-54 factor [Stenotrophomonas acidaminiphila]
MKTGLSTQLGQQLHLTPQLLQSIRLLQLDGLQLELEVRRALDLNPLLEVEETHDADQSGEIEVLPAQDVATLETAAFDELPESSLWDVPGAGWQDGDDDRMQRVEAGESSDPHVRVLDRLALELDDRALDVVAFWLEHTNDAGYLEQAPDTLALLASARFDLTTDAVLALRDRLLRGEFPGLTAADVRECLQVQLDCLQGRVPGRHIAHRIVTDGMALLAAHEYDALARLLDLELDQVMEGVRLVLSLDARPGVSLAPAPTGYIVPDVVAWHADCAWRVALNPATTPRLRVNAMQERALDQAEPSEGAGKLRELLQEARWLTRGLSIRYDTLLRTARAIVERQAGFLTQGDEAMAPLTLKEIADAIGMHESTVSRITTGKYMQTPRGTFELKHFFAVRLEGANVSGPAVRAMVRRLIDSEPAGKPLADEAIAGLLARQGIHIARRTVAKYREQLDIAPARERRRATVSVLAKAG